MLLRTFHIMALRAAVSKLVTLAHEFVSPRCHPWSDLFTKQSGNIVRVGIFLDFVGFATRAPAAGH